MVLYELCEKRRNFIMLYKHNIVEDHFIVANKLKSYRGNTGSRKPAGKVLAGPAVSLFCGKENEKGSTK
jgi:hypothetical protein